MIDNASSIRAIKEQAKLPKEKKRYSIPKVSVKKQKQLDEEKKQRLPDEDSAKEAWFKNVRKKLVGTCQCGCGQKSQKADDTYFRNSCCHILPQRLFESVKYHPLNYVERAFWGGCHTNMDDRSISLWPNMADFDDIREKFFELAPLLTGEERATKFYSQLEILVYANR